MNYKIALLPGDGIGPEVKRLKRHAAHGGVISNFEQAAVAFKPSDCEFVNIQKSEGV